MEDKVMRKKVGIFLSLWLCISMILLPFAGAHVNAAETNTVTLNFDGASIEDGKVTFAVDDVYKARVTLCTRDIGMDSYTNCPINENNMQIDLSDKEYYLKATTVLDVSSPDDLLGISSVKLQLYINDESYDISSNPYVKLDTSRFSGNLNFRIEKVSTPPGPGYPDDILIRGTYDGYGMEIFLNSARIGQESNQIQGTGKGYASGEINNLLGIQLAFGDGDIGTVTVNGKAITLPEGTKDRVEFTVAPANEYIIEVTKKPMVMPRTIIWSGDKADNMGLKDYELLKNGTVEIIEVKNPDGTSSGLDNVDQNAGSGYASIVPGSEVILRMIPEYGYQLESTTINGQPLIPLSDPSTYAYTMPDENVHISGIFTKTEDQIVINTDKVKKALIRLDENEITSGNSRLTIQDTVLTQQQLEAFKKAAGDYRIAGYFDIKLAQILYKNTASNLWIKDIETLKKSAGVSLQIQDDWEPENSELIVIHEKQDGTYEVIPAAFDTAAQTVMFQTDGFSNYAVAYKKIETTTEDNSEVTTETSTEDSSEPTTANRTEVTTEASSEITTETTTEITAEVETEATTGGTTEVITEDASETTADTTEVTTQNTTEDKTGRTTEERTRSTTEDQTEIITESPSEHTTEITTGISEDTTTEDLTDDRTEKGSTESSEIKSDNKTSSPKTGDDMNLAVLYILLAVSGMGCLYTIRKR